MADAASTFGHVVFLHNKFRRRAEDRYLIDMACAMRAKGYKVSLFASELESKDTLAELTDQAPDLSLQFCGWWLPSSWRNMRSILMALRMLFFPPTPTPSIIVMDVNTVGLYLLSLLSGFRLIYVNHFGSLHKADVCSKGTRVRWDRLSKHALHYADEIIVPSESLADLFYRSFPAVDKEIRIVHPCVESGPLPDNAPDISRLVPDLPKPSFLFVTFGSFTKRSNFKLVLQSFEDLLVMTPEHMRNNLHLIIAGTRMETGRHRRAPCNYWQLIDETKLKSFAAQVTFLRRVNGIQRRTLMEEAICVLFPCKYEPFPQPVLSALASRRPIVAVKGGFAQEALRHRVTALLVDPEPQVFASAMCKVLTNPNVQVYLSDMGHDHFIKNFSQEAFNRKINGIVQNCAEVQLPCEDVDKLQLSST